MATTLQLRRGTAAEAAAFIGAVGELFIDTQNKLVYLHDGVTAGGVLVGGSGGGASVVSGSVSGNTLTLTNSDASTVNINVASLAQDTDTNTYVTSATVSGSVITLHNNNGSTVDIQLPSSVTGFLPSEVQEDMLPAFDAVYDLGSPLKKWYDVHASNSVKIGAATLSETNGVLTVNTEIVASNLTGTDLVANEALIGTALHTGSTITPEGTPGEYVHAKGTLTVDGNLSVDDNLSVRNKIQLVQKPVIIGKVIDVTTTPGTSSLVVLDNNGAMNAAMSSIYFGAAGTGHVFQFTDQAKAAAFAATLYNGAELNVVAVAAGYGAVGGGFTITAFTYGGGTSIDFYCTFTSGTPPYIISAWSNWYWPWYSGSSNQLTELRYGSTIPTSYTVSFDGAVPQIADISKLYINGSEVSNVLTSNNTTTPAVNKYNTTADVSSYFHVNDTVAYKTSTTSLVFGDVATGLSKAITYNESTGVISYDGLASNLNYSSSNGALYTINASSSSPGQQSIALGSSAYASAYYSTAIGVNSMANAQYSLAVGTSTQAFGQYSTAIGYNARASGTESITIGNGTSGSGSYATYIGRGGDNIGNMYHNTVIGMVGQSTNGWMWGSGRHVLSLGTENMYLQTAGDYATTINGGSSSSGPHTSNLLGGSTWFAPQDRHGELILSTYQYYYSSGATTIYPQFGYTSNASIPQQIYNYASTSTESTLKINSYGNCITQGKVVVTVMRRNSDTYGVYEIAFVARRDNANSTSSILSQSTTALAVSGDVSTYWTAPTVYLNGSNLQFALPTAAGSSGNYITVHVGGDVRVSSAY